MKTRIWILDDHQAIRALLEEFINGLGEFLVVGSTESIAETQQAMAADQFDMLLLDLDLEGCSGLDLLEATKDVTPLPKVIIISADVSSATLAELRLYRISGFIAKSSALAEIADGLRRISSGEAYYCQDAIAAMARQLNLKLTNAELRVANVLAHSNNKLFVAQRLGISVDSARRRVALLLKKLGTTAPHQFMSRALSSGIVDASRPAKLPKISPPVSETANLSESMKPLP